MMLRKRASIIFLLVFSLGLLLRLYYFPNNPPSLYWDEASIGYNAFSIGQTGKDEWGSAYPILFKSFGDYKLPGYIYLVAIAEKFFGLSAIAIRIPSLVAGVLTVIIIPLLTFQILQHASSPWIRKRKLKISLLSMFLLAISPWHLQFSRAGFEANVALFFTLTACSFFFLGLTRHGYWLIVSFLFFALSMYTYHSFVLFSPLIFIGLVVAFSRRVLDLRIFFLLGVFVSSLLLVPLLKHYVFSPQGRVRAASESVVNMPGNTFLNFGNNFVANFSTDFLFFKGDQNGRHSVKKMGQLYGWELFGILVGIYLLIRERSRLTALTFLWLAGAAIPVSLTLVSPHALRNLTAIVPWTVISSIGTVFLAIGRKWVIFLLVPVVVFSTLLYLHLYYIHYPKSYSADWQYGFKEAVLFSEKYYSRYSKVYFDDSLPPVYILLYSAYSPELLQKSNHNTKVIGKYHYLFDLNKLPPKTDADKKELIIAPYWMISDQVEILREVRLLSGDPLFRIYER